MAEREELHLSRRLSSFLSSFLSSLRSDFSFLSSSFILPVNSSSFLARPQVLSTRGFLCVFSLSIAALPPTPLPTPGEGLRNLKAPLPFIFRPDLVVPDLDFHLEAEAAPSPNVSWRFPASASASAPELLADAVAGSPMVGCGGPRKRKRLTGTSGISSGRISGMANLRGWILPAGVTATGTDCW